MRFALLYGSAAAGEDTPDSDVDVLVSLRDGRDVEIVRLEDAERKPSFLELALDGDLLERVDAVFGARS